MSLFEDERYQYCDTFFVYFQDELRPAAEAVREAIEELGERYEVRDVKSTDGLLDAITICSPHDRSAMDITFVRGEEVREQIQELMNEFRTISLDGDDYQKLVKMDKANARLDVFHFEQVSDAPEQMLDPGGLLLVMGKLKELCDGIGLDPQSKTLI